MNHEKKLTVLVISAHTDDGEFGCGGTISKYIRLGHRVINVAFSACERSLPAGLAPDTLVKECEAAAKSLQLAEVRVLDFDVRTFPEHRQKILDQMLQLNKDIKPNLVLVPSSTDLHQDHQTIHNEAKRAFKYVNMLGYELPWNNIVMTTTFFSGLSEEDVKQKVAAIACYKSQSHRNYYNELFLRSLAITRGTQIGQTYAEAFELIKWIDQVT